jgi:hypothetical protein
MSEDVTNAPHNIQIIFCLWPNKIERVGLLYFFIEGRVFPAWFQKPFDYLFLVRLLDHCETGNQPISAKAPQVRAVERSSILLLIIRKTTPLTPCAGGLRVKSCKTRCHCSMPYLLFTCHACYAPQVIAAFLPARSAESWAMPDLYLRKIIHPQAHDNYRVEDDGLEIEIGSIGIQQGSGTAEGWAWGIDNVIPMREAETQGSGTDRKDCMKQFKAAWDRFSADPARLTEFLEMKRKRLR